MRIHDKVTDRINYYLRAGGSPEMGNIISDDLRACLLGDGGDRKLLNTFLRLAAFHEGPTTVQEVARISDDALLGTRNFGLAALARLRALIPYEPIHEPPTVPPQQDILEKIYDELKAIRELLERNQ